MPMILHPFFSLLTIRRQLQIDTCQSIRSIEQDKPNMFDDLNHQENRIQPSIHRA